MKYKPIVHSIWEGYNLQEEIVQLTRRYRGRCYIHPKDMSELMMKRLINERMLGKKIDFYELELFENKSLGRLLFKVLPIFELFDEEINAKINRDEEKALLEDLDISEDGYLNAYNFYHEYGIVDDRIAQIFIHHILKSNIIKNKPKNDKGLSKLFSIMDKHAMSYILLVDLY